MTTSSSRPAPNGWSPISATSSARAACSFCPSAELSQRAQVANTLAYRRRKGTAAVLEQLARDVTGWNASVVEFFQLLATTQYMNHLRPENLSMARCDTVTLPVCWTASLPQVSL